MSWMLWQGLKMQRSRNYVTGALARAGLDIRQDYDESIYIRDSVAMLRTNLLIGIALAIGVLWWFLRRFRATCVVALAIPISLFTAFIDYAGYGPDPEYDLAGRPGVCDRDGLDAAIVMSGEHRPPSGARCVKRKRPRSQAPQVWGALVASTATTVVIFLPIMFLKRRVRADFCGSGAGYIGCR